MKKGGNLLPLDRRTQMAPSSFSNVLSRDIRNGEYMVKSCIEQIPMWHYLRAIDPFAFTR